jgi:hypothetical protein
MHHVMLKASEHFKVPALEKEHWMSSFSHIVRDMDLIKSEMHASRSFAKRSELSAVSYISFAEDLSNLTLYF